MALKVLIVDDSPLMRMLLKRALAKLPDIDVVAAVGDGEAALGQLQLQEVDLVLLDLEMPGMDGTQFLIEKKRRNHACEVLVFSAVSAKAAAKVLELLSHGALDFIAKPTSEGEKSDPVELILKALGPPMSAARARRSPNSAPLIAKQATVLSMPATSPTLVTRPEQIEAVVIASSTGGPPALETLLRQLPQPFTRPLLLVQHMPPVFTAQLAQRLEKISGLKSVEATHGMVVENGVLYVAPGGFHMEVIRGPQGQPLISVHDGPQVHYVRPAADLLFESAVRVYGGHLQCLVLTGMGEDGARGAKAIQKAGGRVWIQNRETCCVYGMPGATEALGAHHWSTSLENMREQLIKDFVAPRARASTN